MQLYQCDDSLAALPQHRVCHDICISENKDRHGISDRMSDKSIDGSRSLSVWEYNIGISYIENM